MMLIPFSLPLIIVCGIFLYCAILGIVFQLYRTKVMHVLCCRFWTVFNYIYCLPGTLCLGCVVRYRGAELQLNTVIAEYQGASSEIILTMVNH